MGLSGVVRKRQARPARKVGSCAAQAQFPRGTLPAKTIRPARDVCRSAETGALAPYPGQAVDTE